MANSNKSKEQLQREFSQRVPPAGWDEVAWRNLREHALGEFWQRRFAHNPMPLSSGEVKQLLSYAELETALGVLGDAARMNLLSDSDRVTILENQELDNYPKSQWMKSELRLRDITNRLIDEPDADTRIRLMDRLLRQKRLWPLESVLDQLADEDLKYVEEKLSDRSTLTKYAREQIRQAIRRDKKQR